MCDMNKILATVLLSFCWPLLSVTASDAKPDFIFRYGQSQAAQHPRGQSMSFFEAELESRSGGRIAVENYFSSVLGTEREMMDMVATGMMQGTRGGLFVDANPKFSIFMLPFLMESWEQALRLLTSNFTKKINIESQNYGFYIPATGISQGFRAHTNNVRPIHTPDDLSDLKMRVPQQEVYLKTAQSFGASPHEMPASEIYQAFKLGVIDGQDNPPANIWDYKLYEVQQYLTITHYATGPDPFVVSLSWYRLLPDDLQIIFNEVAHETMRLSDKISLEGDEFHIEKLSQYMSVNFVVGKDLDLFRSRIRPVYQYFIDKGHFSWQDIRQARCVAEVGDKAVCPTSFIDAWSSSAEKLAEAR
jgi:tripartite ATP-independent transporter DctP family solute receptor